MQVEHLNRAQIAVAATAPIAISLIAGRVLGRNYLKWGMAAAPVAGLLAHRLTQVAPAPPPLSDVEEESPTLDEAVDSQAWEAVRHILERDPYLATKLKLDTRSSSDVEEMVAGMTLHRRNQWDWIGEQLKAKAVLQKRLAQCRYMPESYANSDLEELWRLVVAGELREGRPLLHLTADDLAGPYAELGADPAEVNLRLNLSFFTSRDNEKLVAGAEGAMAENIAFALKQSIRETMETKPELIEVALRSVRLSIERSPMPRFLCNRFTCDLTGLILETDMTDQRRVGTVRGLLNIAGTDAVQTATESRSIDWDVETVARRAWATDYASTLRFHHAFYSEIIETDSPIGMCDVTQEIIRDMETVTLQADVYRGKRPQLTQDDQLTPIISDRRHPLTLWLLESDLGPRDLRSLAATSRTAAKEFHPMIAWREIAPVATYSSRHERPRWGLIVAMTIPVQFLPEGGEYWSDLKECLQSGIEITEQVILCKPEEWVARLAKEDRLEEILATCLTSEMLARNGHGTLRTLARYCIGKRELPFVARAINATYPTGLRCPDNLLREYSYPWSFGVSVILENLVWEDDQYPVEILRHLDAAILVAFTSSYLEAFCRHNNGTQRERSFVEAFVSISLSREDVDMDAIVAFLSARVEQHRFDEVMRALSLD